MRYAAIVFGLMVFGLFLAEPTALAQIQVSVITDTQPFNDFLVIGALLAQSNLAQTTLTFTFPGPISTTAGGIQLLYSSGVFATASLTTNPQPNTIQVILPAVSNNVLSGSFRIVGFNFPACGPVSVAISSLTNNYLLVTANATNVIYQPPPLVITRVTESKQILRITGRGAFCSPQVSLGDMQLTGVVPIPGGVSAILPPNIAPGTYLLDISRSSGDSSTFDVAIGLNGSQDSKK